MNKWVYNFNKNITDGNSQMNDLLGGKGANLAEMSRLGFSVPSGFTISTEACLDYQKRGGEISDEIREQCLESLKLVENLMGKKFGDVDNPLLFSVRSGARVSMPGMMDTVLNLGLNDDTVQGLAKQTRDPRFAWDSYRRFIQMYADVVLGLNISILEHTLENLKEARGVREDIELKAEDWKELCQVYKGLILKNHSKVFPSDPIDQLWKAISAVFDSWNNARAKKYRQLQGFSNKWGTAVNVQIMVFGNRGGDSGTGVCFTRDPSSGEKFFFGEYLANSQGEDVVSGIRTPGAINKESKNDSNKHIKTLEELYPPIYQELKSLGEKLELHYRDMQDIEFTIEKGKLYLLQTRSGKRAVSAALKIAVELVDEQVISIGEALTRVSPKELNQLLHPRLNPSAEKVFLARGLPASPGAAGGVVAFTSEEACHLIDKGEKVVLVRQETSPDDIAGMAVVQGILTARGGMTSHAAVVARGMGKPCVAGCSDLTIDHENDTFIIKGKTLKRGSLLTIDGGTGEIFDGVVPTIQAFISKDFFRFMSWADEVRKLKVYANADKPEDCETALRLGAEGIGLCRTEHMFFAPDRILAMRRVIFSHGREERLSALLDIKLYQKEDFKNIFKIMKGRPVNIRLLDPPLHEFVPHNQEEKESLAQYLGVSLQEVEFRIRALHEFNPMLGHRGCRLGIIYPEIYEMQVRAIVETACECQKNGVMVHPEIMVPLVGYDQELAVLREMIFGVIGEVQEECSTEIACKVGTMVELPRAAIMAGEIARHADFFSFGTNDLTQTTLGLSRDDSGRFLPEYISRSICPKDPFVSIDEEGVGFLVAHACREGRNSNKSLLLGICGEHGGDPESIDFFHRNNLDYISCSPFRIPIARLAAAQASLKYG